MKSYSYKNRRKEENQKTFLKIIKNDIMERFNTAFVVEHDLFNDAMHSSSNDFLSRI